MVHEKKSCDLCGIPIESTGITLNTIEGMKAFCCDGCRGMYQMLHEKKLVPEPQKIQKNK
jgi:hypothetical protein